MNDKQYDTGGGCLIVIFTILVMLSILFTFI